MSQKISEINILGIILQIVVTIIVLVLGIISLFNNSFLSWFEIFIALDLMIMACNNIKIYQKKGFTFYYFIVGIFIFIIGILSMLGVI